MNTKTEILDEAMAALKSERDRGVKKLGMRYWHCETALCVCGAMAIKRYEDLSGFEIDDLADYISCEMDDSLGDFISSSIHNAIACIRRVNAIESELFTTSEIESFKFLKTNDLEFDDAIEYIEAVKAKLEANDED